MKIRIVKRPRGEAPENIRDSWIGLVLPLAESLSGPVRVLTFGVVSGPPAWWKEWFFRLTAMGARKRGYAVEAAVAFEILRGTSPSAAEWWQTNTAHFFTPGRYLLFEEECCAVEPEKTV